MIYADEGGTMNSDKTYKIYKKYRYYWRKVLLMNVCPMYPNIDQINDSADQILELLPIEESQKICY